LKTLYSLSDFFNQSLHYGILHLGTLIYNNIEIVECSVSSILKADMQKIPVSSTGKKCTENICIFHRLSCMEEDVQKTVASSET